MPEPINRDETLRVINAAIDKAEKATRKMNIPDHVNGHVNQLREAVEQLTECVKALRALVTGNADVGSDSSS